MAGFDGIKTWNRYMDWDQDELRLHAQHTQNELDQMLEALRVEQDPQQTSGPPDSKTVEVLERELANSRIHLAAARRRRDRIEAEVIIAKAREQAAGSKPIPKNPGWSNFAFNVRFPGEDGRVFPAVCAQYDGKISVVAGDAYWFFDCWDDLILWLRDTEQVKAVSSLWKLTAAVGANIRTAVEAR